MRIHLNFCICFHDFLCIYFYFFALQETVRTTEKKKNYTSWSSPSSSSSTYENASWIFSRAKDRDESRKRTVKTDWLFDRAQSRKKFHDLTNAEWYNRKVYSKHCDQDGNCKTIDYVSNSTYGFCNNSSSRVFDFTIFYNFFQ